MLQFGSDPIAIVLGEVSHALALGQILAHEPVGVLVGASLSVVVRRGKVEPRLGRALERPVLVKLGALVHGDRLMKRLMQKLLAARVRSEERRVGKGWRRAVLPAALMSRMRGVRV